MPFSPICIPESARPLANQVSFCVLRGSDWEISGPSRGICHLERVVAVVSLSLETPSLFQDHVVGDRKVVDRPWRAQRGVRGRLYF